MLNFLEFGFLNFWFLPFLVFVRTLWLKSSLRALQKQGVASHNTLQRVILSLCKKATMTCKA